MQYYLAIIQNKKKLSKVFIHIALIGLLGHNPKQPFGCHKSLEPAKECHKIDIKHFCATLLSNCLLILSVCVEQPGKNACFKGIC